MRHHLDPLIRKARASHPDDPESARRELVALVSLLPDDVRDGLAFEYARRVFDETVRATTLTVERTATTPSEPARPRPRESSNMFSDSPALRKFSDTVARVMDDLKRELRVEWTRELLDSSFALGDGTFTTWGEATIEQHEARKDMHATNATAAFEGHARHALAIDEIRRTGTTCLNEASRSKAG